MTKARQYSYPISSGLLTMYLLSCIIRGLSICFSPIGYTFRPDLWIEAPQEQRLAMLFTIGSIATLIIALLRRSALGMTLAIGAVVSCAIPSFLTYKILPFLCLPFLVFSVYVLLWKPERSSESLRGILILPYLIWIAQSPGYIISL